MTGWAGNQGAQHPVSAAQINVILGQLANQIAAQGAILSHLFNVLATPGFQNQGLYAAQSRPVHQVVLEARGECVVATLHTSTAASAAHGMELFCSAVGVKQGLPR